MIQKRVYVCLYSWACVGYLWNYSHTYTLLKISFSVLLTPTKTKTPHILDDRWRIKRRVEGRASFLFVHSSSIYQRTMHRKKYEREDTFARFLPKVSLPTQVSHSVGGLVGNSFIRIAIPRNISFWALLFKISSVWQ